MQLNSIIFLLAILVFGWSLTLAISKAIHTIENVQEGISLVYAISWADIDLNVTVTIMLPTAVS